VAGEYQTFDVTLTTPGTPERFYGCSMSRGARRFSLLVEGGDVRVWLVTDVAGDELPLRKGESWYEESREPILLEGWELWFVNENAGETPRLRGVVWR
jgi:hypothetical protein